MKREAEAAGELVRIMTVHGAKGLQAPLVILPDTTGLPKERRGVVWADDRGPARAVPLWAPRKEFRCDARRPAARRRAGAANGGTQQAALRRADPRRGPAGGLRLARARSA